MKIHIKNVIPAVPKMNKQFFKIGFVLDDGLDRPDGVQQYVLTLGNWLVSQGHEVHYLVGHTTRTDIANIHSVPQNVKVKFNGNKMSIPLPASARKIKDLLRQLELDVIHVQVPYSPFFGAKVVANCPPQTVVIGTFHIFPYGFMANVGTRLLGKWLRLNLRRFDAHLSVSSAARRFASDTFYINSKVVPNMVDTTIYRSANKLIRRKDMLNIVFVGRLVKRKGCHLLLEALAQIRIEHPDLRFHLNICGKGELLPQLESMVLKNKMADSVTFHGYVTENHKIELLQSADIAIFPSYAGESFGIVLIEAMAAGSVAVLGGINPGYSSVLTDVPESLIKVKDLKAFSEQLGSIIKDESKRQEIHEKQQLLVRRYDVETVGPQVLKAYTEGIESKRAVNRSINHE